MAHKEAVAITINSIHRNDYVLASGSPVEWTTSLEQTGTARFRMQGVEGDWIPLVGQNFGIYDQTVPGWGDPWQLGLIFAGSIDSVTPMRPSGHPTYADVLQVEVTGSSREQVLQRRLIRPHGYGFRYSRYKSMTAGAIAYAMLTDHCDGENLVLDPANFDDGPLVNFVAWNHQTCAEAMTQLANYAGCHWWVAPDSTVYFREREAVFAPWGIVDGDNQCTALSIRESRENLSNAVFYRASFGSFTLDPLFTDDDVPNPAETVYELVADGETYFTTETQIQDVVDISVAGPAHDGFSPSTMAEADGTEQDFWFIPGDDGFSQTTGKPPLPAGTVIMIHYHRLGGDVLPFEDATAISDRAAVEIVGSGRYELAAGPSANVSASTAQQRASMIVQERRNTALVVEGETKRKGLAIGQALIISTTRPPINDTFLVTSITAQAVPGTDKITHRFSGVNGAKLPNGWDFFTGLGDSGFGGGFGAGFQTGTDAGGGGVGASSDLAKLTREVPAGAIDGTNRDFTLSRSVAPPVSLLLSLNGVRQDPLATVPEYVLIENAITYAVAPQPGDKHEAYYFRGLAVES